MRWLMVVLGVGLALGICVLAVPRLIGAIVRLPGDESVDLAAGGNNLRVSSYLRAIESREASIAVMPDRRTLAELGILYQDRASQAPKDSPQQTSFTG